METREILGVRARVAKTFRERAKGLIGTKTLPHGEGMLIERCNAIHTFFMSFPIDIAFLDKNGAIVRQVRGVKPWRPFVWGGWRARMALETKAENI
ncbi:MAG: DUF192 domain-containing protein [Kiritimatiellae bacterium]|nr:DUF192 domain-containing protein [Kiritimatiellia bacterium]